MERLVTVKDIAERYGVTRKTAASYIRRMYHYENPLAAPQWAFDEWEQSRAAMPANVTSKRKMEIKRRKDTVRIVVPRKRG